MKLFSLTLAAAAIAGSAHAAIPVMQINVSSSGGGSASSSPVGQAGDTPNQYNYISTIGGAGFLASFNLIGTDTGAQSRALLGGAISVVNASAVVQTFTIDFYMSTVAQGPSSLTGGSISGVLAGNTDGGYFASVSGQSIWTAYIRNPNPTTISQLLNSPYMVTAPINGVASIPGEAFGTPIPSQPSIAMADAVGIRLVFQLGAGDQLNLTTAFVVQAIPGPGAVAAFAALGAVSRRRRRD